MSTPATSPISLVTGGNKGLGHETARQLVAAGHLVLLGSRDADRGRQAADEIGATPVTIDVTDDASVAAAAELVRERYGRLDVLVNNAGVVGPRQPLADVTSADASAIMETNVVGIVRVTHAFLPLLRRSPQPRIVNVSSGTARITWQESRGWPQDIAPPLYSTSKAAVTMLTLQYAHALDGVQVNAAWPGYTATDLNDFQGTQTVDEGAAPIVHLATLPPDGPTGTFIGVDGTVDPW